MAKLPHIHDLLRHCFRFYFPVTENAEIIIAIIGMAKGLDFKTIAEGVETKQQLEFLRLNACDQIQGYLFSKPLPAAEFELALRKGAIELP